MKSKQQIFDTVIEHLIKQNVPSLQKDQSGKNNCAYRNGHGNKCAIGCLITDEVYTIEIENHLVSSMIVCKALADSGIDTDDIEIVELLIKLQQLHDKLAYISVKDFSNHLKFKDLIKIISDEFKLTVNFVI